MHLVVVALQRGIIFEGKEKSGLQFFLLEFFRSEIEQTHFAGLSFSYYKYSCCLVLLSIGLFCDYDFFSFFCHSRRYLWSCHRRVLEFLRFDA